MAKSKAAMTLVLVAAFGLGWGTGEPAAQDSPEAVVKKYYAAYKDGKYAETYDYVTEGFKKTFLRTDKPDREAWAKQWKTYLEMAGFQIIRFTVYPAKIEGDTAIVPNKFETFDKYANQQGVTEYELLTLKRENGQWKVDSQSQAEKSDIPKWFPSEEAPSQPAKQGG